MKATGQEFERATVPWVPPSQWVFQQSVNDADLISPRPLRSNYISVRVLRLTSPPGTDTTQKPKRNQTQTHEATEKPKEHTNQDETTPTMHPWTFFTMTTFPTMAAVQRAAAAASQAGVERAIVRPPKPGVPRTLAMARKRGAFPLISSHPIPSPLLFSPSHPRTTTTTAPP